MKYFLDTEFYEDGKTIDLISIGIVAEDGREFYAVNADFDWDRIWNPGHWGKAQWVRDNVIPQIDRDTAIPAAAIRDAIIAFVNPPPGNDEYPEFTDEYWFPVEFWGFYSATDWVAFYQLWGRLIDLPKPFPKWCRDIKQLQAALGNVQLPYDPKLHHALRDARWQKIAYDTLIEYAKTVADIERVRLPLALFGIK